MPRQLHLGIPVNSSHGQLVTHASRHTVNSSQVSTEQSSQSLLLEHCNTCHMSPIAISP